MDVFISVVPWEGCRRVSDRPREGQPRASRALTPACSVTAPPSLTVVPSPGAVGSSSRLSPEQLSLLCSLAPPFSEMARLWNLAVSLLPALPQSYSLSLSSVRSARCWGSYGWNVPTFWKPRGRCCVTQLASLSSGCWISRSSCPRRGTPESWSQPTTHSPLPTPATSTSCPLSPKRYLTCLPGKKETWGQRQRTCGCTVRPCSGSPRRKRRV